MIVIEPISSTKDEESIAKALKVPDSSQIKIIKVDSARKCIDTKKLWIEEIAFS
ncbi:hypothetical protein [Faecalibaculum rodentium]|nr:hypothetical protein [Faecalibaculum rodentium]